jgi:hypothetical protein
MKPAKIAAEFFACIRSALKADPDATICVGTMTAKPDGGRTLNWAIGNGTDPGELVEFADTLLASAAKTIAAGRHPDCDNCRESLKRIAQCRAVLGVETPEGRPS